MSTSRQDFLIASLKNAEDKKALLRAELKKAEESVKNLKKSISTIDKEVTGIYDELIGKVSYPILDAIEEAQQPTEVTQPIQPETLSLAPFAITETVVPSQIITFERVGKRGDSFDCVHFYRGSEVFQMPFDKIELRLIGDDPSSYKNYLDLCDTAWNELHKEDVEQKVLASLIDDLQPLEPNWIVWKIEENTITLLKGVERRIVPTKIVAKLNLDTYLCSSQKSLETLWDHCLSPEEAKEPTQEEIEPTPQAAPEVQHDQPKEVKEKYIASVQPGGILTIALASQSRGFGSIGQTLLTWYGYTLYDTKGDPAVDKIPQKVLEELWNHHVDRFVTFSSWQKETKQKEQISAHESDHDDGIDKIHRIFLPDKSLVLKLGGRTRKVSAANIPENFNPCFQDELNQLWVSDKARDYYPKDGELPNIVNLVPPTSIACTVVAGTPTKTSKRKSKSKSTEVTT